MKKPSIVREEFRKGNFTNVNGKVNIEKRDKAEDTSKEFKIFNNNKINSGADIRLENQDKL